jgi:uncharacterized membrane protein YedE/YeeE
MALAGGCSCRQLFLAGEGDGDSAIFVLGVITGAGLSHNFALAGAPDSAVEGVQKVGGLTPYGMAAVVLGLAVCVVIGLTMRQKMEGWRRGSHSRCSWAFVPSTGHPGS